MFWLGMTPKENYSTLFNTITRLINTIYFLMIRIVLGSVFMVAIDMYWKKTITGEQICGITWKQILPLMFFLHLFVYLIIFLRFLIRNGWFVLAINRILRFIFILQFIRMFFSVNMPKFCKWHFKFYCKWHI